jgi:translation initiation factor IF-3
VKKRILVNNEIRAEKVRVVDSEGKQLGIFSLEEALKMAKERNLDLILITEKVDPPVCKIGDLGKYLYQLQKKEKGERKESEVKGIRLGFNISLHDLETRVDQAEKFLKKGDKIKIELILRGREKGLSDFGKEKIQKFLELLEKRVPIKIEEGLKKVPRGFIMIVSKK